MTRIVRLAFFPAAALLLAAGTFLALQGHAELPTGAWLTAHPAGAFGLALTAGFADGLNPCAITTLLLFIGGLLALAAGASKAGDTEAARARVWPVALAYIAGIFVLYFGLGVGFIEIAQLQVFGNTHAFTRLAGLVAVPLGLIMVSEGLFPGSPLKLAMPASFHGLAHRWGRRTSVGGAFAGGVLIGTCTIPCGGAMYLAVAAVIGGLANEAYGYTILTAYNLAFIAPLIILVSIAGSRDVLTRLSRLHITHRGYVKTVLGVVVVLVGLFALL